MLRQSEKLVVALKGEPKESKCTREEQKVKQETHLRDKAQEGLRLTILPPWPQDSTPPEQCASGSS